MKYKAKILPSKIVFDLIEGVSILESAIKSGINLEYSCMDGSCGSCKSRLVEGETVELRKSSVLTESDRDSGYILTCCSRAISNIELIANYYPELLGIKQMIQPCKVDDICFPSIDIAVIKLRIPPSANFRYLPGQYIQLIYNGERRSYSIANIMEVYDGIELHVNRVPGGLFSEFIFNELKVNKLLRIEGPFGSFFVRDGDSPIIFLAGGTGFAPVKSMVEKLLMERAGRDIYIYWGVSSVSGLYSDVAKKWQLQYENVQYVPVLSGNESWGGRNGFVHKAVLEDIPDLSGFEVYACGSNDMIKAARKDFLMKGLSSNNFYSDAFIASKY